MRQVLVRIPLQWLGIDLEVPIFGFGTMLVVALFLGVYVASRRARKEGIAPEHIQDVAFYVVLAGIVGARIVHMIQFGQFRWNDPWAFFRFWEGGLVFYGSLVGGLLGYALAYRFVLAPNKLSVWKLADIITPSLALGLALGRIGCLLNGCCFGGVACPNCAAIQFPAVTGMASQPLIAAGLQTAGGFTLGTDLLEATTVAAVEPGSPAERAGLKAGDRITALDGHEVTSLFQLEHLWYSDEVNNRPKLLRSSPQVSLTVERGGEQAGPFVFTPRTLPLHPTQIYETISMTLLFCLLTAYYPFRRHDGEVFALFLTCYPIHRFLNEMLRRDTEPVAFGMTLSQNISLLVLLAAAALWIFLLRKPAQYPQPASGPPG